jgi:8-oxo-dGTP pyrophosphatase MutT (NUDIX family)
MAAMATKPKPATKRPKPTAAKPKQKPTETTVVIFHNRAQLRIVPHAAQLYTYTKTEVREMARWLKATTTQATRTVRVPPGMLADFLAQLGRQFVIVLAAGGVVRNTKGDVLCIYRLGSWDLPKGKLEPGEDPPLAAMREVMEETGLRKLALTTLLPDTYHVYALKSKWVLKQTFWFEMQARGNAMLKPQTEEDIDAAVWMPPKTLLQKARPMYGSIRALLQAYLRKSRG